MGLKYPYSNYFGRQEVWEKDHRYIPPREYIADTHIESLKNIIIETLRDLFENHQQYQYVPRTDGVPGPDLEKTGIVITDVYTYDTKFLPCVTVRVGASNTRHISFNQDVGTVDFLYNENGQLTRDSMGRPIPIYYEYNGAWDSSVTLNVFTESTIEREELVTFLGVIAINLLRDKWRYEGMFVKTVSVGGETETLFANDYIYNQAVTLDVYSEWTRKIPVPTDLLEGINYSIKVEKGVEFSMSNQLVTPPFTFSNAIFWNGISWQVKSLYRDLLEERLDLNDSIDLLNRLINKVNDSGTQLLVLPISHHLTSFNTINIDDFLLLISHTDDSLREDGLLLAKMLDEFIDTLLDPGQVAALIPTRDRLRNIERTLTEQLVDIGVGYVPK